MIKNKTLKITLLYYSIEDYKKCKRFKMSEIINIKARELFDSRGNPTIEAELKTTEGIFTAMVPSGASTGEHEALELRDKDSSRFFGKGVLNAVKIVNEKINPLIKGMNPVHQQEIDKKMIKEDGTQNKKNFGANSILAASMAICKAGAAAKNIPLYKHIADLAHTKKMVLPVPSFNVINGGMHAGNNLAMQEFMILPVGAKSFKQAMQMGVETYHTLKKIIQDKYGKDATTVGDEGGFAPNIEDNSEALNLLTAAIEKAGYTGKIKIGMDVAASEFFKDNKYDLGFKDSSQENILDSNQMVDLYSSFVENYDLVSIEDPFDQNDWDSYAKLTKKLSNIQIVGDDLLVTNPERITTAIQKKSCNALLLKVNQIGSVTESIAACTLAKTAGWGVMVSHRSGETEDSFIADLVVGLKAGQIKSGAPCRSERLAKYNQLLRIEEQLGNNCIYAGKNFRNT